MTVTLPFVVDVQGDVSLYLNAVRFNALDVPGTPTTVKLRLTKTPPPVMNSVP